MEKVKYEGKVVISKERAALIDRYLNLEKGLDPSAYQGENAPNITESYVFPDGMEMEVQCCGCDNEASWTQAVLFDTNTGSEEDCSPPESVFTGAWELEGEYAVYGLTIAVEGDE